MRASRRMAACSVIASCHPSRRAFGAPQDEVGYFDGPWFRSSSARRRSRCRRAAPLPLRLLEIPQVRRRLVFLRRHQVAVAAEEIADAANFDVAVALGADFLDPFER